MAWISLPMSHMLVVLPQQHRMGSNMQCIEYLLEDKGFDTTS